MATLAACSTSSDEASCRAGDIPLVPENALDLHPAPGPHAGATIVSCVSRLPACPARVFATPLPLFRGRDHVHGLLLLCVPLLGSGRNPEPSSSLSRKSAALTRPSLRPLVQSFAASAASRPGPGALNQVTGPGRDEVPVQRALVFSYGHALQLSAPCGIKNGNQLPFHYLHSGFSCRPTTVKSFYSISRSGKNQTFRPFNSSELCFDNFEVILRKSVLVTAFPPPSGRHYDRAFTSRSNFSNPSWLCTSLPTSLPTMSGNNPRMLKP